MKITILRLILAAAMAAGSLSSHAAEKSERPNIIFIVSDDQAWGDYGFMGHPHIATPNLDKLAAQSVTFQRGYIPASVCRPSLVSIVTGLYPHQHGVTGNDPLLPDNSPKARRAGRTDPRYAPLFETVINNFAKRPNIVRDLTERGYVSLQTGKWWEGDPIKTAGFTHAMTAGVGKGERHGGKGLEIGRQGLQPIQDFIEEAGDKPFLVWYAPLLPHDPHTPPADLLAKYQKLTSSKAVAAYWANVEWFDRTCGELLDLLEQKGLRENTIILYTVDNGYIQSPTRPQQADARSKLTAYEGGVRTPIMVSWPAKLKPRMDKENLASTVDFWPTIAALIGTEVPTDLPGINLADEAAVAKRQQAFGESSAVSITDVENPSRSLEHRYMVDGWWKVIAPDPRNLPDAKPELYNLKDDPWEKKDLSAEQPERLAELLLKLDQWWSPQVN